LIDGGFNRCLGGDHGIRRKETEADSELFRQINSLLGRSGSEELTWQPGQKPGAVTACAIGVHTTAVRKALERGERVGNEVVTGGAAEARDKARSAGIMVRMAPVGAHTAA
jgi:hypothetical protein